MTQVLSNMLLGMIIMTVGAILNNQLPGRVFKFFSGILIIAGSLFALSGAIRGAIIIMDNPILGG